MESARVYKGIYAPLRAMDTLNFKSTRELKVPKRMIDQVIGQENVVEITKKAASQRRHLLLIGEPGTGKSMIGMGLAELLPKEKLVDILAFPNPNDENQPLMRTVPAGKGREIAFKARLQGMDVLKSQSVVLFIVALLVSFLPYYFWKSGEISDVIFAASMITGMVFLIGFMIFLNLSRKTESRGRAPKVIVDNFGNKQAPFHDATGAHAGALLGDVMHDPFQCISGEQCVHLSNGKSVPIAELIDPLMDKDGEYTLDKEEQFEILGGLTDKFGYSASLVTKLYRRKFKGNLIRIKTGRGYSIRVTPNHPIAVFQPSGNIEWINADKLTEGMLSVVPERLPVTAEGTIKTAFLHFLAETLSDGTIRERSIAFKVRTPWKAEQFQKTILANKLTPKVMKRNNDIEVYAHSAELVQKLTALGIKKNGRKNIPSILFSLSRDQIMEFLARYISIDGYVGKQGQFEIMSKELIPDLTGLLLKVGIRAKIRYRLDPGFGHDKGIIQQYLIFGDYTFAQLYHLLTINPVHQRNLDEYLASTRYKHVSQDDVIPVAFEWLENIRRKAGLSKTKTHQGYYALNQNIASSISPTRLILRKIVEKFLAVTNDESLFRLRDLVQGSFAYDKIVSICEEPYEGHVYNMTTNVGTYVVSHILTHNSGGLGTPAHERVVAGMIHKANMGVLFIDEIATLKPSTQQELLTALQEGKFAITGQSERSAGAMVRTEPVPCNFIMIAAGNLETLKYMHPALRSRIRGYGYEVYMKETMLDNAENRLKIARFIAQEVVRDGKIPHFSKDAVLVIIEEARKRANRKGHLTLRLRELGGIIRAAGDIAIEQGAELVQPNHVQEAKKVARTLEQQLADKIIERRKEYEVIITAGEKVGRVNGLAVLGGETGIFSGIILPIEAQVAVGGKAAEIIATGKLGEIAKEAVKNVSAIIKNYFGEDIKGKYDLYVQFLQTYEGVEGDSASIAVATAVISALEKVPVRQDTAMTGSLTVRGDVLPIGGVSAKVEAAIEAGLKQVIVPHSNMNDIVLDKTKLAKIKVTPVDNIIDVLKAALNWKGKEKILQKIKK